MKLHFVITGEPRPKQSARFYNAGKFIRSYQTQAVKNAESNVKMQVISQLPADFVISQRAIMITKLHYIFSPLKTMRKSDLRAIADGELVYKMTKPDLTDNLNKGVFDALQGIIYVNDSQIISMNNVKKIYGYRPRIELELEIF